MYLRGGHDHRAADAMQEGGRGPIRPACRHLLFFLVPGATAAIENRRRDGLSIARNVREGTRREQFVGFSTVAFRDHFIRQDFRRAINAARHAEVDGVIDQKTPWFVEANLFSSYGAQI